MLGQCRLTLGSCYAQLTDTFSQQPATARHSLRLATMLFSSQQLTRPGSQHMLTGCGLNEGRGGNLFKSLFIQCVTQFFPKFRLRGSSSVDTPYTNTLGKTYNLSMSFLRAAQSVHNVHRMNYIGYMYKTSLRGSESV